MSFVYHWVGLDNGSSRQYLFWSGIFGDLVIFTAAVTVVRHHNCSVTRCLRMRTFPVMSLDGTPTPWKACKKHHPHIDEATTKVTPERMATWRDRHPDAAR